MYRRSLDWSGGRREDAEDALGQAALIALEKMPRDLHPNEARSWLLRLVYSKCMDIHRKRKRARSVTQEIDAPSLDEEALAEAPSLESVLLEGELVAIVKDRIRRLPPKLRAVAELHLLGDLSYSEIADFLAITEANVRKRMQNARAVLREHLEAYLAGDAQVQAPREPGEDEAAFAVGQPEPLRASGWSVEALRKYIHRHPRGWKKRWELALRLREAGFLEEAVFHFRGAASRQPRRAELWSDLGTVLLLLQRAEEALPAFETALRWASDEVSRSRLRALIERCRGHSGYS
jgi:RNA polymerase sigma-70 factor (ECF subfamily)